MSGTNSLRNARIRFLPFKYANALTDLSTNTIYLSNNISPSSIEDVMMDEYAHIASRSGCHKKRWQSMCRKLYGKIPQHNANVDKFSRSLDNNISPNIGNITGIQNMLLDYHMLQAYRKFSQRVLGTEGSWEVNGDGKLRLMPTPKGSFPVVVRYIPSVDDFRLPTSRDVCTRALIAEAKIILGHTRRKMTIPSPDGGTMTMDGGELVTEGREEKKAIIEEAILLGEPLPFVSQ